MSHDEIVSQLQQIVAMLKRTIEASGELAERVEGLERRSGDELGILTSLQGNLQVLLEQHETQVAAQSNLMSNLADTVARLQTRIEALEASAPSA
jgi:peptidoglycan hydrolase CwlO-like protein